RGVARGDVLRGVPVGADERVAASGTPAAVVASPAPAAPPRGGVRDRPQGRRRRGRRRPNGRAKYASLSRSGMPAKSFTNGTSAVARLRAGARGDITADATTRATVAGSAAFRSPHRSESCRRMRYGAHGSPT